MKQGCFLRVLSERESNKQQKVLSIEAAKPQRARASNATSPWLTKMLKLINLKWLEIAFNLNLLVRVYPEQNISEPEIRLRLKSDRARFFWKILARLIFREKN